MSDRPTFRRLAATPAGPDRGLRAMLVFFFVVAGILLVRAWWEPRVPVGIVVEVVGSVPRPGAHLLPDPVLSAAVAAAGGDPAGVPDTLLHEGDRVVVGADGVHVAPSGDPLLVALPVDLNSADSSAIAAIPGVGPATAAKIVFDRERNGRFGSLEDLERVAGVGPDMRDRIAPFVTIGEPSVPVADPIRAATRPEVVPATPKGPIDLNSATARQLETLPGIGPVTAARIVVDRDENGPYGSLDDLERVKGVGPKTLERLRGSVVTSPPP